MARSHRRSPQPPQRLALPQLPPLLQQQDRRRVGRSERPRCQAPGEIHHLYCCVTYSIRKGWSSGVKHRWVEPAKELHSFSFSLRPQASSGDLKPSSSTEAIPEPEQALPASSSSERLSPPLPTQQPPKPQPPPTITGPFKINMQKYVSPSVASRFTNGALKLETPDTKLLKEPDVERPKFAASRLVIGRPSSP